VGGAGADGGASAGDGAEAGPGADASPPAPARHYDPATGELSFTFTDVAAYWSPFSGDAEIPAGDKPFWSTRVKAPKAKTYTFFFAEQGGADLDAAGGGARGRGAGVGGVAGARSSGGGLALLVRV